MIRPLPAAVSAALAALAGVATAQTEPPMLDTVVVVGRKDPDASTPTQPDLPTARTRIELTPGGVGIVDAERYREGRVSTLSDALGYAAGVSVQPRFGAEEARVSIRGSGLQRTFHGRGLKLMQDGVPLNLADGSFDFQAIEPLTARYVEVWRGANALQYGAATLGGAVNFVSPNGINSDLVRARAEAGSFGYRRALAATGDVFGEGGDYYVGAGGFRQDGYRDHAKQDTGRAFANLGWQLTREVATRFYLGYVNSVSELPGSITRAQLEDDPRAANPGNVALDQHRDIEWTRLSNKTVWQLDGRSRIELFGYASYKELDHPIFQVIRQRNRDAGLELRYEGVGELYSARNRFVAGIAPSSGRTHEDRYLNVAGSPGARTNASEQRSSNVEVYAENQWWARPDLALVAGLQWARATRVLDDRYVAGTPADPRSESFEHRYEATSPKLGLVWTPRPGVQWFANLSKSFEPPSFGELAGGVRPLDNDAQRATTFELGTRGRFDAAFEWDLALYDARVRDELLSIATNDIGATITVNAPRTRHRGMELGLGGQARPIDASIGRLEWRTSILFNDFRFEGNPTYGDARLPGLPRSAARAQIGWRFGNGTLVALQAEGASGYAIDFARSFNAPGYGLWGLRLAGDVDKQVSWFVDARNLSDKHYAATTGIVRDAGRNDVAQFLPGDGRAIYAGIDWRYNR